MKKILLGIGLCALGQAATAQLVFDGFDTIDPAWGTDRYEPAAFESVADPTPRNDGNVLHLGISDADSAANRPPQFSDVFYNTQGRQQTMTELTGPTWSISADVFIDNSWDPALGNSRRTGLWSRDSTPDENSSNYPIISFSVFDTNDPFDDDPNNVQNFQFRLRAWDSLVGWHPLSKTAFNGFGTWNNVRIDGTGSSFDYYLNGSFLWSDTTASQPGNEDLKRFFIQGYNFGLGDYDVYWDNLTVVPAPAALSLFSIGAIGLLKRKR